ncbi:MAG TPA: GUN4 domain-containing protein [Coleofasciculaceae cyanobacterium]
MISTDFLNTDYCNQVEIPEALRRHEAGKATVMPMILRSCGWKYTPLAAIQAYPEKAKPIVSWTYINDAYTDVVNVVYLVATEIKKGRDDLRFDRNINYKPLRDLLKAGKWKEADQETADRMCEVMKRPKQGWLRVEDIQQFSCTDLQTTDQLWVKYSGGKFGFSIQKKIWQECGSPMASGEKWVRFCVRAGWKNQEVTAYLSYLKLKLRLFNSPLGELLHFTWLGVMWGEEMVLRLFSRAKTCGL